MESRCPRLMDEQPGHDQTTEARISKMAFSVSPATALNPWLQILAALEKKMNRATFETWFKPTRYSHVANRLLFVRV